jgi:hypothetical protein
VSKQTYPVGGAGGSGSGAAGYTALTAAHLADILGPTGGIINIPTTTIAFTLDVTTTIIVYGSARDLQSEAGAMASFAYSVDGVDQTGVNTGVSGGGNVAAPAAFIRFHTLLAGPHTIQGRVNLAGSSGNDRLEAPINVIVMFPANGGVGPDNIFVEADFAWSFPGTLVTTQNILFPGLTKKTAVDVQKFDVLVREAPTGTDAIFQVLKNGIAIATVTLLAGQTSATVTLGSPVMVATTDVLTAAITQVGGTVPGTTATIIARIN